MSTKFKPRVGLMVFSESLTRESVYKRRKKVQYREVEKFKNEVQGYIDLVIPDHGEVRSSKHVLRNLKYFACEDVEAIVLLVPIFTSANLVVSAANLSKVPVVLFGNEAPDSVSQLSLLATAGAIEQLDLGYKRLPGDIRDEEVKAELVSFLHAASVYTGLKGSVFGCFGGRSLGLNTAVSDIIMWQKYFGVDIEHIDQLEIVQKARSINSDKVTKYNEWLKKNIWEISFDGKALTPEILDKALRSYIATKDITKQYGFDFIGVKCQPEMSNGYVAQCLNTALQNDPYDAEGSKVPIACSCEADADGALTMHILKLISGGEPSNLQDIVQVKDGEMTLANCGSLPTYFAALSKNPRENLRRIKIQPNPMGAAGGGSTQFIAAEGTFTFARLARRGRKYWMGVFVSNTIKKNEKELKGSMWTRPHTFVKIRFDKNNFMKTFLSNHIHSVQGDYLSEIKEFCHLAGIECTVYS